MAGSLTKAYERSGGLKGFFGNIFNYALGKKLEKLGKEKKKEEFNSPYVPTEDDTSKSGITIPPDTEPPPPPPNENDMTPYRPESGSPGGQTETPSNYEFQKDETPVVPVETPAPVIPKETTTTPPNYSSMNTLMDSNAETMKYNERIKNDLVDFISYASRFGEQGKPFIEEAIMKAKLMQKPMSKYESFKPEDIYKDSKTGNAYTIMYDPVQNRKFKVDLGIPWEDTQPIKSGELNLKKELQPWQIKKFQADIENTYGRLGLAQELQPWNIQLIQARIGKYQADMNKALGRGTGTDTKLGGIVTRNGFPIDMENVSDQTLASLIRSTESGNSKTRKAAIETINKYYGSAGIKYESIEDISKRQDQYRVKNMDDVYKLIENMPPDAQDLFLKEHGPDLFPNYEDITNPDQ